jgi:hypothetical protein
VSRLLVVSGVSGRLSPTAWPEETDWTLELTFSDRATLNRVKRRLRKLAGKGASGATLKKNKQKLERDVGRVTPQDAGVSSF